MTTYTAFGGGLPAGTSSTAAGGRTDSIVFEITTTAGTPTLEGVWYYVPSSETVLTGSSYTALVYTTVTGTTSTALLTSNAGSGTFTAGAWNFIPLTSPVVLSTGIWYAACISSPNWLQFEHTMWGAGDPFDGGFVLGPVHVPDQAGAPGGIQQGFIAFASTFPNQANVPGSFYGVDFSILVSGGTNISAQLASALAPAVPALGSSEIISGHLATALAPLAPNVHGLVKQNVSAQLAASLAPMAVAMRQPGSGGRSVPAGDSDRSGLLRKPWLW